MSINGRELGLERMSGSPDQQSQLQSVLHHLKELETVAERKAIKWNTEGAIAAEHRMDRLVGMLRRIVTELTGH